MVNFPSIILSLIGLFGVGTTAMLARDVCGFFTHTPIAATGLCMICLAAGYWVHAFVRFVSNSRANEEKALIKRLHAELKEKDSARYYDISCLTTLEALAERLSDKKTGMDSSINALKSENDRLKTYVEECKTKISELDETNKRLSKRRLDMQKVPGATIAVDTLSKAARALTTTPSLVHDADDPLSKLIPSEIPFLLRVYDEAQAHVGTENLKAARNLHAKGAVVRTDAPESGVISQCDVALTDEWVAIMNARADELRARA